MQYRAPRRQQAAINGVQSRTACRALAQPRAKLNQPGAQNKPLSYRSSCVVFTETARTENPLRIPRNRLIIYGTNRSFMAHVAFLVSHTLLPVLFTSSIRRIRRQLQMRYAMDFDGHFSSRRATLLSMTCIAFFGSFWLELKNLSFMPLLLPPCSIIKGVSGSRPKGTCVGPSSDFQAECVAFFTEVVQVFGVPKSIGQIYGLLFASPEPLSFSDIVERLNISKGSASQGLQLLRSLRAINVADMMRQAPTRKHIAGGPPLVSGALHLAPDTPRRDYYEPELGLRHLISGVLHERVAPLAVTGVDHLTRLRELAEQERHDRDFYLDRVRQLETWRRRLKTVVPVLNALLGPKTKK